MTWKLSEWRMVFKIICLFFHIVDLILSVIDLTRGFITSNLKRLSGGGKVIIKLIRQNTDCPHYTRRRAAPMPPQPWWLWWASSTTSTVTPALRPVAGVMKSGIALQTGDRIQNNYLITFLSPCDPNILPILVFKTKNWNVSTLFMFYIDNLNFPLIHPFICGILIVPALHLSDRGWVFPISQPGYHYTIQGRLQTLNKENFPQLFLALGKF